MRLDDDLILFLRPIASFDGRIQMIVPPLTALLAQSTLEMFGDEGPLLLTVLLHEFGDEGVFFFGPRSFDEAWLEHFLPAVEALYVTSILSWEGSCYFLPVFGLVLLYCDPQSCVFGGRPLSHASSSLWC